MTLEYPKRDATVCHWCRKKFYLGQARYLVEDEIDVWPAWERVPICGLCWVDSNAPSTVNKLIKTFFRFPPWIEARLLDRHGGALGRTEACFGSLGSRLMCML